MCLRKKEMDLLKFIYFVRNKNSNQTGTVWDKISLVNVLTLFMTKGSVNLWMLKNFKFYSAFLYLEK